MNNLSKDIINEWGLGSLPPAKQEEMVERIGKIIYQALLVRSLDILTDEEQDEFDKLLDKDETTPEEVFAFLGSKIPDFQDIVLEERRNLKRDLLITV